MEIMYIFVRHMKVIKNLMFVCMMFTALGIFAQGYKHYSIENGLPSNRVYKILQDKQGFIWVATDKGVSKFDGKTFKNFTTETGLPTNDIWEIYITDDNRVWFFTRSDKLGYIQNDSVYAFSDEHNSLFYPVFIARVGNRINFFSHGKNYGFNGRKWQLLDKGKARKVIHKNVSHLNIEKPFVEFIDHHNSVISRQKVDNISTFISQINDSLVIARTISGFFIINLNTLKAYDMKTPGLFTGKKYIRVISFNDNIQISGPDFWANLSSDFRLENIRRFPAFFHSVTAFKDKNANYWINTFNDGIYLIRQTASETRVYLPKEKIRQIKKYGHDIYAGVIDKGLYKYNPVKQDFEFFFPVNGYIYDFYINDNDFVIISNHHMYVKQGGKLQKIPRKGKKVQMIDENLYLMSVNTIKRMDLNKMQFEDVATLHDTEVLVKYHDTIIAGTPAGLFYWDAAVQPYRFTRLKNFKHPVLSAKVSGDKLLIGTDGFGLFVWDGTQFKHVEDTGNLIINHIETDGNNIFLATQKGVLVYKKDKDNFVFERTIRKMDGLISDQVNYVIAQNNRIFSAGYNGISAMKLTKEPYYPMQSIYLKKVLFNDRVLDSIHNKVPYAQPNNLQVHFGVIDFSGQEHNKYYYKLLPGQTEWTETESGIINFSRLSPNDYQLFIRAENPYKQRIIKRFDFSITPLWWQTSYAKVFFILSVFLVLMSIALLIRKMEIKKQQKKLRIQKEMAEHELHALRSQMNPHFVFNSLNSIQFFINDKDFKKSEGFLVKFARLIRMIFDFSSKKSITLEEEINMLESYLTLEKMRFGDDFNFCIDIDKNLDIKRTYIPTMLLQPLVENAVNHGLFHKKGKGMICLSFTKIDENTYEVSVSDDGIGIERSKQVKRKSLNKHHSKSTKILMDRIKLLNISGKWKVSYRLQDFTADSHSKYNTVVTLKITRL